MAPALRSETQQRNTHRACEALSVSWVSLLEKWRSVRALCSVLGVVSSSVVEGAAQRNGACSSSRHNKEPSPSERGTQCELGASCWRNGARFVLGVDSVVSSSVVEGAGQRNGAPQRNITKNHPPSVRGTQCELSGKWRFVRAIGRFSRV